MGGDPAEASGCCACANDNQRSARNLRSGVGGVDQPGCRIAQSEMWTGDTAPAAGGVRRNSSSEANVAAAVDDRLAQFELYQLQLRTLDFHIFNLPDQWTVESGDATIQSKLVKYRFDRSSPQPIVMRCEFDFPADPKALAQADAVDQAG